MPIPFTQYLRPNGERRQVTIVRSPEIEALAQEIRAKGYNFECEELNNGIVSFTVVSPHDDEGDICIVLVPNGPRVPAAVDDLVRRVTKLLTRDKANASNSLS
jgi:DNA-binding IclR family transcriptional regulator